MVDGPSEHSDCLQKHQKTLPRDFRSAQHHAAFWIKTIISGILPFLDYLKTLHQSCIYPSKGCITQEVLLFPEKTSHFIKTVKFLQEITFLLFVNLYKLLSPKATKQLEISFKIDKVLMSDFVKSHHSKLQIRRQSFSFQASP